MAALDLILPPFPFTAIILTAGTLDASVVSVLPCVVPISCDSLWLGSVVSGNLWAANHVVDGIRLFHDVAYLFTVLVSAGTLVSVIQFISRTRDGRPPHETKQAA